MSKRKNRVFVGRHVRLDLKTLRCGQCRKKIGAHASFLMGHVVNANNPLQHGLIPMCSPCFARSTDAVGAAIEAMREVAAGHRQSDTGPLPIPGRRAN